MAEEGQDVNVQRSIKSRECVSPMILSGTANGISECPFGVPDSFLAGKRLRQLSTPAHAYAPLYPPPAARSNAALQARTYDSGQKVSAFDKSITNSFQGGFLRGKRFIFWIL